MSDDLFTDNFERGTPLSGWSKKDHLYKSNWYKSRAGLLIQDGRDPQNGGGWTVLLIEDLHPGGDLEIEAHIRALGDAACSCIGLVLGYQDPRNYIRYEERKDYRNKENGFRRLIEVRKGNERILGSDTYDSDYIPTHIYYRITEKIRIQSLAHRLLLWHDNLLLWDLELDEPPRGAVGLYSSGPGIMACQHFSLRRPLPISLTGTRKGPYLQNPTTESMTVMWETWRTDDGAVEYGPAGRLDREVKGSEQGIHSIRLSGLRPGKEYGYRVRSGNTTSPVYRFRTIPRSGPFRFCVYGDTHCASQSSTIARNMLKDSPSFVICVGDATSDGRYFEQWDQYFRQMAPLFHSVPSYHVVGNHEGTAGDAALAAWFFRYLKHPGYRDHYAFTHCNCRFLVINNYALLGKGSHQHQWLLQELRGKNWNEADFRFAFFHEPPYCIGWGIQSYDGNPEARTILFPFLREHDVDIIFTGHCHDYERAKLDGVNLVITGGGGGALDHKCYDVKGFQTYANVFHHVTVDVDEDEINLKAEDLKGKRIDSLSMKR